MAEELSPREKEYIFFQEMIAQYLKYGSVDEVFKSHDYNLPISYPAFHRLVNSWGIVKAAGPNSKLSEAVTFLHCLSEERIPLEKLYRSMPPSFQTSMSTLHRILHCVKEGVTRRIGTALVVTAENDPNSILVANDISNPRVEVGKPFGSVSLPMGYSKPGEAVWDSVTRILQQEVYTKEAVTQNMPNLPTDNLEPFMFINIADVKVQVVNIVIPEKILDKHEFNSFKLENFRFVNVNDVASEELPNQVFRSGIIEIANGYQDYRFNLLKGQEQVVYLESYLNKQLSGLALDYLDVL